MLIVGIRGRLDFLLDFFHFLFDFLKRDLIILVAAHVNQQVIENSLMKLLGSRIILQFLYPPKNMFIKNYSAISEQKIFKYLDRELFCHFAPQKTHLSKVLQQFLKKKIFKYLDQALFWNFCTPKNTFIKNATAISEQKNIKILGSSIILKFLHPQKTGLSEVIKQFLNKKYSNT